MRIAAKILISLAIIVLCTQIGRKNPSLAGLIAVMPLTGLLALLWLWSDNPNNYAMAVDYCRGALWGIIPSILFFLVAFLCFRKELRLWMVLCAGFAVWLAAAIVHQLLLRK